MKEINVQPNSRYQLKIDVSNTIDTSLIAQAGFIIWGEDGLFTSEPLMQLEGLTSNFDGTHTLSFTTDAATNNIVLQVFMMLNDSTQNNLYFTINNVTLEEVNGGEIYTINQHSSLNKYRFGFNGAENLNEVKGYGNTPDLGDRWHDPRLGKLIYKIDRLTSQFPWQSPYVFAGNDPISNVDVKGDFKFSKQTLDMLKSQYPTAYMYLVKTDPSSSGNILEVAKDKRVVDIMIKNTMHYNYDRIPKEYDKQKFDATWYDDNHKLTPERIEKAFTYGSGPEITFRMEPGGYFNPEEAGGFNPSNDGIKYGQPMQINTRLLDRVENAKSSEISLKIALTNLVSVIIHEYMEYFGEDEIITKSGDFGAYETQREIFGGKQPGVGVINRADAVKLVQNHEKGTLDAPAFIPTVPQKKDE